MQFKQGTSVYTVDDKEVGRIDRVVIDPATLEVTHLVIRKGLLLTEDKVVPIKLVEQAAEDRVVLKSSEDGLNLPNFEEAHYLSADAINEPGAAEPAGYIPPLLAYPPAGTAWWGSSGAVVPPPLAPAAVVERNIPEGTVALKEGAAVISANGEHVGNVDEIFVDEESKRATHFVISKGLIFKSKKLVPTSWVTKTEEDKVHLSLRTPALDKLPNYEAQV